MVKDTSHTTSNSDSHSNKDGNGPSYNSAQNQHAIELIRDKLDSLYDNEPATSEEIDEVKSAKSLSKHQKFMYELSTSGKDLATVQTEWHTYYQGLTDSEKHQVWKEFYDSQSKMLPQSHSSKPINETQVRVMNSQKPTRNSSKKAPKLRNVRSAEEAKETIKHKVTAGGKLKVRHQLQSLFFGLGIGFVVVFIFMFGFFNEVFLAPFIQPSRVHANTPLIVNATSIAPSANPEVIIPKINVEIPVVYSETSTNEATIENDLQDGVVHYPTTVLPGQLGNATFFGHSSNNIFNQGKYKFAFVLLHTLQNGDTFYLTYNSKIYVYKVISRTIVDPSDVGVLGPVSGQAATATLITCDPPGTSLHRLVVVGQQISPDPAGDTQSSIQTTTSTNLPTQLPGNGQTLWGRFISGALGKLIVTLALIAIVVILIRIFIMQANKLLT